MHARQVRLDGVNVKRKFSQKAILDALSEPAYLARMKRLQDLSDQIDRMMTDVYNQDRKRQTEYYRTTGTEAYYRGIYDVQRQVGFQFSFAHIDRKEFDRLLKSKWSGESFSDRVWDNTQAVADAVKDKLMLEMLTGKKLDDCAEAIQHRFQVGAFQSRRIIRTESNYLSGQMQMRSYAECGSDKYRYVATLDSRTDDECGALDGKIFPLSQAMPGVNMHPMHPFCRCTSIIVLDDDDLSGLERRARDPVTGEKKKVPAATTYEQWAVDNGLKTVRGKVTEAVESTKSSTKSNDAAQTRERGNAEDDTKTVPISMTAIENWFSVLKEYTDSAEPGKGSVSAEGGRKVKNKEWENAELIRDSFGGDIVLLGDLDTTKKNPDYSWRNKLWEQQGMERDSKNSVDQNIREGIQQIRDKENPGGIILDASVSSLGKEEIEKIVFRRLQRSSPIDCDVILIRNNVVEDVFRYKK